VNARHRASNYGIVSASVLTTVDPVIEDLLVKIVLLNLVEELAAADA
jgi:hypothetical protein